MPDSPLRLTLDPGYQPGQAHTFVPLSGHGEVEPSGLQAQPRVAQAHACRVERVFGDNYGICETCGARSLPIVRAEDAALWRCPIGEAEAEVSRNLGLWRQRFADAHAAGYFDVL